MVKPWSEVEQSEQYKKLPDDRKAVAKQKYWDEVVTQKEQYINLPDDRKSYAKQKFFGTTKDSVSSKKPSIISSIVRGFLKSSGIEQFKTSQFLTKNMPEVKPPKGKPRKLTTIAKLAQRLGINKSKLHYYVSKGVLKPTMNVGGMYLFFEDEVRTELKSLELAKRNGMSLAEFARENISCDDIAKAKNN